MSSPELAGDRLVASLIIRERRYARQREADGCCPRPGMHPNARKQWAKTEETQQALLGRLMPNTCAVKGLRGCCGKTKARHPCTSPCCGRDRASNTRRVKKSASTWLQAKTWTRDQHNAARFPRYFRDDMRMYQRRRPPTSTHEAPTLRYAVKKACFRHEVVNTSEIFGYGCFSRILEATLSLAAPLRTHPSGNDVLPADPWCEPMGGE